MKLRFAAFACFLSACNGSPTGPLEARWQSVRTDDYIYRFTHRCFCPEEWVREYEITVVSGVIDSVALVGNGVPVDPFLVRSGHILTIDQLFDEIEEARDAGAHIVEVDLDPTLGYPSEVFIDFDEGVADDEQRYLIRDVQLVNGR